MNEGICDKVSYATRGEAGRQIAHLRKRGRHTYSSYKCDNCGQWHITTTSKNKMKNRKKTGKYPFRYEPPVVVEEPKAKNKKQKK